MKRMLFILATVFLLTGCGSSVPPAETESTATAAAVAVTENATQPATQPTEPELPWDPDARWYGTYYFDKRPNPDPNIVEGVVRFNSLLKNEDREPLTIQSAHADFYQGTSLVAQEDFDGDRLLDFLPHPRVGDLVLEYGEPTVFQLYSTTQEPGSYDRVIVTYALTDVNGSPISETFHFAVNAEDVTPYSFSERTDWSPAAMTDTQWIFHMFPYNTTDKILEYVGMYSVGFQNGLPMGADFFDKSVINHVARKDIETLQPGEMMHYQEGITHRFNSTDQREHTMVYKDDAGELYLFPFRFALVEEWSAPDPLPIYVYSYEKYGLTVLNTPELKEQETGKPKYTRQEIRQMIDNGLTLEELAEKFSNLCEVQMFIEEACIDFSGGDIKHRIGDILWHFNDSPKVVLQQRYGDCGSGSSLINYLLRNDYDEQGYLKQAGNKSGHIFNYFRSGDRYYIFDWTKMHMGRSDVFIADSLENFSDAYVGTNRITDGLYNDHSILLLYAYPYEGNHRPMGDGIYTPKGAPLMHLIPNEIEDVVDVLFVEQEQYAPVFVECPPVDQWPEDAQ